MNGVMLPIFDRERTIVDAFRTLSRETASGLGAKVIPASPLRLIPFGRESIVPICQLPLI